MVKYKDLRQFTFENAGRQSKKVSEEYANRYYSVASIRLPFKVMGYNSFVMYNDEMMNEISAIYQLNSQIISELSTMPSGASKSYVVQSLIEEIQQSNEFENVESTRQEIETAYVHSKDSKYYRFVGMVNKYTMLVSKKKISLATSSDIRALYDEFVLKEVVQEDPGDRPDGEIFRKGEVHVLGKTVGGAYDGLFPEPVIIETMDQALSFFNDNSIDILIRVSVFHFIFGYIHPFYNGNGRMARFITGYKMSEVIDRTVCLRMSYIIKKNKSKYQRMFKNAEDRRSMGDLTRFVIDFLGLIHEACVDVKEDLHEKNEQYKHQMELLEVVLKNELSNLPSKYHDVLYFILERTIFVGIGATMDELMSNTGFGKNTLNKVLQNSSEIVQGKRMGRRIHWFMKELGDKSDE